MHRGVFLCAAFAAVFLALPAQADIRQFKDWLAVCDNLRNCAAYGFDVELSGGTFVKIERGGAPGAAPKVMIAIDVPDKATQFTLAFDEADLPGLPKEPQSGTRHEDDSYARAILTDASAVEAFLTGIRKAQKIVARRIDPPGATKSDTEKSEISLSGAAAALLWIDDQQKRLDTVTAIIKRGSKPASAVPPPQPAAPVVVAAKPIAKPAPTAIPKAVINEAKEQCDADDGERKTDDIHRLNDKLVLYVFLCESDSGAYNYAYNLITASTDRPGEASGLPLVLPPSIDKRSDIPAQDMTNASADPKTMTISTFSKGRGIGDCGTESIWVFDGKAFRMTSFKMMPDCRGVPLWEWAPLYVATRK